MTDAFDAGLLSPVTAGEDEGLGDADVADALVEAERALVAAYADLGAFPDPGPLPLAAPDARELALAAVAGGNPVIPLVAQLRRQAPEQVAGWIHRGATSQDIVDTALMILARRAVRRIDGELARAEHALARLAREHRDLVVVARTLTQHAVPTTFGLRAANWRAGVRRARQRLAALAFPAQLGGAGGTLAAVVEAVGSEKASRLPEAFARACGLDAPEGVWHVVRWPVTELGDALAQAIDAAGVVAADVATLSRTEIGEVAEATGGGSSAMPQKRNPARSVLLRSAAVRAPHLAATLHQAAGLAVDERPDGAWHAEWPALRELLRLAQGAAARLADLASGLRVDRDAAARTLAETGALVVSERLSVALGRDAAQEIVAAIARGEDAAALVREAGGDPGELLDPARYTGLAGPLTDRELARSGRPSPDPSSEPSPEEGA